jgi:putative nucleotidyltransferase with HDIG domain
MHDKVTRAEALALLEEFGCSENHIRHMRAVEAALRAYARRWGEDEEHWGAIGLLHDFEYDRYPDDHPTAGARILRERGYSEEVVHAVLAHGETGVARTTPLAKALYAVDELTGFLVAVTLVRPSKDIREVNLKSVQKKWKDRAFAADCSPCVIASRPCAALKASSERREHSERSRGRRSNLGRVFWRLLRALRALATTDERVG